MDKKSMITGSILGLLAIIFGAFAAHGLKELVDESAIESFQTGVRYQMYHAILLLFIGSTHLIDKKGKSILFYLILIGVLFFSGSIYILSTDTLTEINIKGIAFITPLGGLLLALSWLIMLIKFVRIKTE
jgi:uncharacterized membrane protein YgdD (TMEM256/DUF423 family)